MNKLLGRFLNEYVRVETSQGNEISGTLISFQSSNPRNHIPALLILQTRKGKVIVRAWSLIKLNLLKMYVRYGCNIKNSNNSKHSFVKFDKTENIKSLKNRIYV